MPQVETEALDEVMKKKGPPGFPSLNCWSSSLDPWPAGVGLTEMATFTSLSFERSHLYLGFPCKHFFSALGSL